MKEVHRIFLMDVINTRVATFFLNVKYVIKLLFVEKDTE